jgi:hypothetical protein
LMVKNWYSHIKIYYISNWSEGFQLCFLFALPCWCIWDCDRGYIVNVFI